MDTLNTYISDPENNSDKDSDMSLAHEEEDANCEPVTMDMSEDSSSDTPNADTKEGQKLKKKRRSSDEDVSRGKESNERCSSRFSNGNQHGYSSAMSESPDSSPRRERDVEKRNEKARRDRKDDRGSSDSRSKSYRKNEDRKRSRDGEHREKERDKGADRERSHHRSSRGDSRRHRERSRSRSRSHHRSSRSKRHSRSRSPYDKYHWSDRSHHSRRGSPYRSSRRSRSRSRNRSPHSYSYEKRNSKLQVLEKLGIELKVPPSTTPSNVATIPPDTSAAVLKASNSSPLLTPQMLLQKQMEEQVEKVKSATGIELPSYYNPIAVNPSKYAEQIQKRRMLWGNKQKFTPSTDAAESTVSDKNTQPTIETKQSGTIWQGATFGGDQDGKLTAKFKRLMGIKETEAGNAPGNSGNTGGSELIKKQEEMFSSMESQYEVARLATHSHRGLGLGFGTFQPR